MKSYSNLPFDIIHEICRHAPTKSKPLADLSMVNKMTRTAAIPFLFYTIKWTQQWGKNAVAWGGAEAKVQVLLNNQEILDAVRKFYFYPWVSKAAEAPIPTAFFSLMTATTGLESLELVLQFEYLKQVKNEIGILSSVKSLVIPTPSWLSIAKGCPNLTELQIRCDKGRYSPEYVEWSYASVAESHPGLAKLHLPKSPTTTEITEIAKWLPNIEELGLTGGIGSILSYLPNFTVLPKLESLCLADLSDLGLGYDPPECGNAYEEEGVAEQVEKERQEAIEKLIKGVEESILGGKPRCPLERLVVGRTSYSRGLTFITGGKSRLQLLEDYK